MSNTVQTLRSSTPNTKPLVNTRQPGELWTNFSDLQAGLIDTTQTAVPLIAVRYFSPLTAYVGGDFVVQAGHIYVAKAVVPIGAFNASQWTAMQTAADVAAGYLPLTGGTLTGALTGLGATFTGSVQALNYTATNGNVYARATGSGNAVFWTENNAGTAVGNFFWNTANAVGFNNLASTPPAGAYIDTNGVLNCPPILSTGSVRWGTSTTTAAAQLATNSGNPIVQLASNYYEQLTISSGLRGWFQNGAQAMTLDATSNLAVAGNITTNGNLTANGLVSAVNGFMTRAGTGAANGTYVFNHFWTSSAYQLWIGAVNAGNITLTSDYRAKKDIEPLPSMWDAVKALKPISFTFKDYTPAIELEKDADALPLIVGSDEEHWGFIAHELQGTLIMSAASGVKDQADCIQSPNPWTVIATLTKALQEAMARIEALEAEAATQMEK